MRYPIVIEDGNETTAFGVIVPDLPGCFSAGDSLDEAIINATEAIELYIEDAIHRGVEIAMPQSIKKHRKNNPDFINYTWVLIDVDIAKLQSPTKRYNITALERAMNIIDITAKQLGESRSEFLMKAATMRAQHEFDMAFPDSIKPANKVRRNKAIA